MKLFTARNRLAENGIAYTCHACKCQIHNGEKYAKKSVKFDAWTEINGHQIYDPYHTTLPVCAKCANPEVANA